MTAPRDVSLDPGTYMEVLEEDLLQEIRRARIYRTQARQLEATLARYRNEFGDLEQSQNGSPTSTEAQND